MLIVTSSTVLAQSNGAVVCLFLNNNTFYCILIGVELTTDSGNCTLCVYSNKVKRKELCLLVQIF